jgi:predicted RNA-binding protein
LGTENEGQPRLFRRLSVLVIAVVAVIAALAVLWIILQWSIAVHVYSLKAGLDWFGITFYHDYTFVAAALFALLLIYPRPGGSDLWKLGTVIYRLQRPYDDSLGAIVGSANLTGGGLEANEEASIALRGHNDETPIPSLLEYYRGLWDANAVVLDQDWLEQYRKDYPYKRREIDESTGASVITDVSLEVAGKQIERAAQHWIVITTPENYKICLASGLWGVNRQTRTIQDVRKGDIITFYIARAKQFSGVYRAVSEPFFDRAPLWPDKLYPWRVRIEPLNQVGRVDASAVKNRLPFIENPEHWGTFLQGEMKRARTADFRVLLGEMKRRANVVRQVQAR